MIVVVGGNFVVDARNGRVLQKGSCSPLPLVVVWLQGSGLN